MWWQSLSGLLGLFLLTWLFSENRRAVRPGPALVALGMQILIAFVLLEVPVFRHFFLALNELVTSLEAATRAGTRFVFGYLGGGEVPFAVKPEGSTFVFALQALPMVLVVSALSALLFYWRVLPWVVRAFAWVLRKTLGLGGPAGVGVAANIFLGHIESPLLIKPYLQRVSRGDLFLIMTAGMATVAGTVMVVYASLLATVIPDALGQLLTASIISAPAAVMVARIMIPASADAEDEVHWEPPRLASSSLDAVARGTIDGVGLLVNIVAMLLVLVALVALVNQFLGLLPHLGGPALSLERLLGWVMAPLTWLMGIPAGETVTAGALMGVKTILNEFLAYLQLAALPADALSERSRLIMTYALCGFANLGSLGILIGGMGAMAPERRAEITALGPRSIVAGTLAAAFTGAVAGLVSLIPN
ncbi:MAG: nucleoside:proton symporter [Gammaproteobacteria bacterium]|jgi:CNT family concentrative nucleoside transporter|nr:nucleoside:proton symporter [Candidatus Thioaporhodococcus sediminis]TNF55043.1 MAG: nucleoside:proton symporter [Gammaproteobacteria bacterium]